MFSSEAWLSNSSGFYNGVATQSLRFDRGSSPHLARTPSSAGNRKTWTASFWVKRANFNTSESQNIFMGASDNVGYTDTTLFFDTNTEFGFYDRVGGYVTTSRKFRDPSAWYHIVVVLDTTQSTASDRLKIYVNGSQETSLTNSTYPAQDSQKSINNNVLHWFGGRNYSPAYNYLGAYLAEFNLIDGTALTPSSFGETKNGVWIPKEYTGSYGTNGFRLQFNQTGTGTASTSTIGADTSGNTNHWTSTNIVASDCAMPDSPENNFSTFNPLFRAVTANTLVYGNLQVTTSSSGRSFSATSIPIIKNTGKWFWEFRVNNNGGGMGIAKINGASGANQSVTSTGTGAGTTDYYYGETNWVLYAGTIAHNGSSVVNLSGTHNYAKVYGALFDSDASPPNLAFYAEGSAIGNIDVDDGYDYLPMAGDGSGGVSTNIIFNAGQDSTFAGNESVATNTDANGIGAFSQAVPTDAKALCSANLPEPTISPNSSNGTADEYFNTVLWTGNSSTQSITGVGFQPDWLWIKSRNEVHYHGLFDSNRGSTKRLFANETDAESTQSAGVTSFDSDGFSLGSNAGQNQTAKTYVGWNWKANGGTTSSNTDGSITSTVQANTTAGFSIVQYVATGSNATIGHGLSVEPDTVWIKNRDTDNRHWMSYWKPLGNTDRMLFNTGATVSTSTSFNNTSPTSTVFSIGTSAHVNDASDNYIAYCFASVEGYSKIGSYTGNGSTDGTFVFLNFRPSFVLIKKTSGSQDWQIMDTKRDSINLASRRLEANNSDAEVNDTSYNNMDIVSNGFKFRATGGNTNDSGATYIYMAFAEAPFKYANAR